MRRNRWILAFRGPNHGRNIGAALAAIVLAGSSMAFAEEAPAARVGRYTMVPADGGFVRLDTETGIVSHCRRVGEGADLTWQCAAIPEATLAPPVVAAPPIAAPPAEKAAENRLAELSDTVEQLSKAVAVLRMRLDAMAASHPPPPMPPELTHREEDRALDFSEELMRRFFGMVRQWQHNQDPDRT